MSDFIEEEAVEGEEDDTPLPPSMNADQVDGDDAVQLRGISVRQRIKDKLRPFSMALSGAGGGGGGGAQAGVGVSGNVAGGTTGGGARVSPVNQRKNVHLNAAFPVNTEGRYIM